MMLKLLARVQPGNSSGKASASRNPSTTRSRAVNRLARVETRGDSSWKKLGELTH
jgi:hypothetical protein